MRIIDKLLARFDLFSHQTAFNYFNKGILTPITYSELKMKVLEAKDSIQKTGLESGDRVGLLSENSLEWVVSYLALVSIGITPALVDPKATEIDFKEKISLADIRAVFASRAAYDHFNISELPCFSIEDNYIPMGNKSIHETKPSTDKDETLAALIFTSGTTAGYKAVMITHEAICKTLDLYTMQDDFLAYGSKELPRYNEKIHLLNFLPWHHVFGLFSTLLLPLYVGFKFTLVDQVTPARVFEVMKEVKPSFIFTVPRLVEAICHQIKNKMSELPARKRRVVELLRNIAFWIRKKTGLNVGKIVFKKVHDQFGGNLKTFVAGGALLNSEAAMFLSGLGFTVLEGYGLSESTGAGFARLPSEWSSFGSVGKPIPGCELQIIHPYENGEGEICIKGPNIMKGYFRNQEATEKTIKNGWLLTGDIGKVNQNGELYILGRSKEMITTASGKKTWPEQIRQHYAGLPHIKEIVVIGMGSDKFSGDEIHAVIVAESPELQDVIQSEIHDRSIGIPHHLRINAIHFTTEIHKTPTMKVKIERLKKFIQEKISQKTTSLHLKPTEQTLLNILTSIAGHNDVHLDHHLSQISMDSLNTLTLINEIKRIFNIELPLTLIARNPVIHEIAGFLEKGNREEIRLRQTSQLLKMQPVEKKSLQVEHIFLTGATGVVGGYILKNLIEESSVTIHCLVRGDSEEIIRSKIESILHTYGMEITQITIARERIKIYLGDIVKPYLGLDAATYKFLTETIDLSIHSAASIQLSLPYEMLEKVNVKGTEALIGFALQTRQKYMVFISSYSVMGDRLYKTAPPFKEDDFDVGQEFDKQGYERTKFEAELAVRSAPGLNWQIMRLGNVFGASSNGAYPLNSGRNESIFYNIFKTVLESKHGMDDHHFYDITPVDYIARSIVYLALTRKEIYSTFHLLNPDRKSWSSILSLIESSGYPLERYSPSQYIQLIKEQKILVNGRPYRSLTTELVSYKSDLFLNEGASYAETSHTERILNQAGIYCPLIDETLIKTYLDYSKMTGYISRI